MGLQKLTLRRPIMKLLRDSLMLTALNDIFIKSIWILIRSNILADLLSREKLKVIADQFSFLQTIATIIASASRPKISMTKFF